MKKTNNINWIMSVVLGISLTAMIYKSVLVHQRYVLEDDIGLAIGFHAIVSVLHISAVLVLGVIMWGSMRSLVPGSSKNNMHIRINYVFLLGSMMVDILLLWNYLHDRISVILLICTLLLGLCRVAYMTWTKSKSKKEVIQVVGLTLLVVVLLMLMLPGTFMFG